jgi:very-short-patch-repair endonuclease
VDYTYKYNYASPDWYNLLKEFAKKNKQFATDAERFLWDQIRSSQLGIKFNRQYIIGDYIVDFVCLEKKLIIEVDGGYHSEYEQIQKDEQRTERLERMGFTVVRFTNEEILSDTKNVIDKINNNVFK